MASLLAELGPMARDLVEAELSPVQAVEEYRINVTMLADDATEFSKEFYRDLDPSSSVRPEGYLDRTLEPRVEANGRFAFSDSGPEDVAGQLERSATRAVSDQARNTLIHNTEREGGKWYRIASATACGFCRLLATRGPVYKSAHAACASHDNCQCKVDVVRPGMTHTPPAHMRGWDADYRKYRREVIDLGQKASLNNIVNAWNRGIRAELRSLGVDDSHLDVA